MTIPATTTELGSSLADADPRIAALCAAEDERQRDQLELIAPKNYMSRAVREAHGSTFAFTSVEGYPGRRWHAGVVHLDEVERLAISRAREVFGCCYANVQPHSGTQANQAVFFALLEPGDAVLSMALDAGGHLSHGLPANLSGRWFKVSHYGVRPGDGRIDYDQVRDAALAARPRLLICGGSSYPRVIDYRRMREIADEVGARLLADIAHVAGLVAGGAHPSPFPHCHVVTTTTNKNLRGPRGALILADDAELGRRLDAAVFPGVQGGPLPEYTAAKAVALGEALTPEFRGWAHAVLANARALAAVLARRGYAIITEGTDTPLVMVDLRSRGVTGKTASAALEAAGLPCNKNLVPADWRPPTITSGLRLGLSAVTTRGLREPEVEFVGEMIADLLDELPEPGPALTAIVARQVRELARRFPVAAPAREPELAR
jgi:glycine hydroxymethyltransferase